MTAWDPAAYRRFSNERFAPFEDLLALVRAGPGACAVDLGCGTGELTQLLAESLPGADVVGIDASAAMLEKAAPRARPGLRFERSTIEDLTGSFDLVFSNAALQWCADHATLFARLYALLRPGGQFVAQFPAQQRPASYAAIAAIAAQEPFRTALRGWLQPWPVLALEDYARLFADLGATGIAALERVYPHQLADADAVADWQSGTVLLAYRDRLSAGDYERFAGAVRARLRELMPERPVFFAFRRAFVAATRPE